MSVRLPLVMDPPPRLSPISVGLTSRCSATLSLSDCEKTNRRAKFGGRRRRDRNPLATHSDASFLQIAAGPGNLRFTEDSIWRISVQMFKRAKFT